VTTTHTSDELLDEATTDDTVQVPVGAPELPDAGLRAQITPWAAMGALVVAAGAVRLAQHTTGADAQIAYGLAAAAFVIAVVAATATRKRITDRKMRHRLVAALYLGASWLTMISVTGVTLGAVAALSILGAGLSLLWWKQHRIGPGVEPGTPDALPTLDGQDLFIERWKAHLGGKGKQFAGAKLTEPEIIKAGYRYTLELVPGAQTVEQVRSAVTTLRSGLRLMPGQDVIVEVHPERPAPAAILTIITRPPIAKPQPWPGPRAGFDSATGSVRLGPFADGEGCGCWRVYTDDSMWGGYIQGAQGSGKSRFIDQIAMSCAASTSHPTIIWYGDGQNGDSSPLLVEHADYAATTFEAIYNMAQAALRVMKINGVENRLAKRVGFTPTAARPGLLMIVDECHKPLSAKENPLLAAATQLAFTTIAREGRKVGVALLMASQSPTLDAFGSSGLADTLRSCLLAGNGLILRSKTSNAKQVFGVDINPKAFPKLPGYGYLCDPEPGARSAPLRGFWVTDELAAYWPSRITWRSLPARQANFAGKSYARRHELAAEQQFADEMLLAMADAGTLDEIEALEQSMDAAAAARDAVDVVEFGDAHPPVRRVTKFWEQQPYGGAGRPAGLSTGQQKVLDTIAQGLNSPKEIMAATGYSSSQVYNLIGELDRLGAITKAGYGRYQTAAPAA
jgi:DNA-binding CsgD family transcriptional regulator